jgi:hypothetical protein
VSYGSDASRRPLGQAGGLSGQPAPRRHSRGGVGRVIAVLLGVLLALAVLAALFVRFGLPAIGCRTATSGAPAGAVSEYCFGAFSGGRAVGGIAAAPDGNP